MRALCGSIIAAGALIGLGLLSLGMGTRYAGFAERDLEGKVQWVKFSQMDTPLIFAMVFLVAVALVGLGIAMSAGSTSGRTSFPNACRCRTRLEGRSADGNNSPSTTTTVRRPRRRQDPVGAGHVADDAVHD